MSGHERKWERQDDHLHQAVLQRHARNVSEIEASDLLPSCTFHSEIVPDDSGTRAVYFDRLNEPAQGCHLIFFDPDNGIEVQSKPYGRKDSCKYLYWRELTSFWNAGHSLLIYQHFPRVERDAYIKDKAHRLMKETGATEVISFETSLVVFFLLPQKDHSEFFGERCALVSERWGSQFQVACHGQGQVNQAQ